MRRLAACALTRFAVVAPTVGAAHERARASSCGPPRLLQRALNGGLLVPPGRLIANRCGAFPLRISRGGRLVLSGSCYVHALQYANYPWIESRITRLTAALPAGTWTIRDSQHDSLGGGEGTLVKNRRLATAGRITVRGKLEAGGGGTPEHHRLSGQLTCGVYVGHSSGSFDFTPTESVFAEIAWPSFALLGSAFDAESEEVCP